MTPRLGRALILVTSGVKDIQDLGEAFKRNRIRTYCFEVLQSGLGDVVM